MPKVLVNAYGVTCEKCDKKVPAKYYYGLADDESWIECIHNGWYCPNHSPTSNCDDMDCECCNLNYEDEDNSKSEVEFDSNAMDNALYKDNLDWTFNKPEESEYSCIYIINRKEWCEVGEHYVDADDMWEDFADCKNCVSEKEYKEEMQKIEMDLQQ